MTRPTKPFAPGDGVRFRDPWGRERTGRIKTVTSCAMVGRPDVLTVIRDDGAERVICASRAVKLWNAPANQQPQQETRS